VRYLFEVAEQHPLDDRADGHLAACLVQAGSRQVLVAERAQPLVPAPRASLDPVEQLRRRQLPIAADHLDPTRVGPDPAERGRTVRGRDQPLDLAEPVAQHLSDVGQELRRAP
jgi:hypothetical protein